MASKASLANLLFMKHDASLIHSLRRNMQINSMSSIFSLQGKTALITGGSSGIGLATAKLFLSAGAKVMITGQDAQRLKDAQVELASFASADSMLAMVADVRSMPELEVVQQRMAQAWGHLDVLFANAGVAFATPLESTDAAAYARLMDVNVKGVFQTVQQFAPMMREGGSIVLNTSWLAEVGTPGLSLLSASKAAVRSLARTWSAELLQRGIRVNAVSPGATDTPIHGKTGMSAQQLQEFAARITQAIPLKRFGRAEDVAAAALFLASDASAYMLGAEIVVDGGFSQL
jgi:NAD(P)-dependent dehydrogenase (short-subunit alcohol dehydrogenase family)